jgi:hypothetical protein
MTWSYSQIDENILLLIKIMKNQLLIGLDKTPKAADQ